MRLQHALVILEEGNTILLLRDAKNEQRPKLPGGRVEAGETFLQAAVRELNEELSITLDQQQLMVLCDFNFVWDNINYHHIIYTITSHTNNWKALAINREPEECSELIWADKYNLPSDMLPPIRETLEKYFK